MATKSSEIKVGNITVGTVDEFQTSVNIDPKSVFIVTACAIVIIVAWAVARVISR